MFQKASKYPSELFSYSPKQGIEFKPPSATLVFNLSRLPICSGLEMCLFQMSYPTLSMQYKKLSQGV